MAHNTTTTRISIPIQRKLKIYAAKAGVDILEITDESVLYFMKNFSASFVKKNKAGFIKSKKP